MTKPKITDDPRIARIGQEILRDAICGVLIAKGWPEANAMAVLDPSFDLTTRPPIATTLREVASVILTLDSRGLLRQGGNLQ